MTQSLCILGSTGSVGTNCLSVVRGLPGRFRVVSLAAGRNLDLLARQIVEFRPARVAVASRECVEPLRQRLSALGYREPLAIGAETAGQVEAATLPEVTFVVSASHGVTGLVATYEAVRAGKRIGLANKETLVAAGELVMRAARESGSEILPIDSEHSALHQCLRSGKLSEVRRVILTGSGGPFLKTRCKDLDSVTPQQALNHPVWKMGGRITIDSATLMNKGLEIIEAHWLFGLPPAKIDVLIHPESAIHSMIEYEDGSVMAQLAAPDMRIPIQYALTYPERAAVNGMNGAVPKLDFAALRSLHFRPPDTRRFPCLALGREALERGGAAPCALNAADEVAVEAFLAGRVCFTDIPRIVEAVLTDASAAPLGSLEEVLACDREARSRAEERVEAVSETIGLSHSRRREMPGRRGGKMKRLRTKPSTC
ncbi:MAG TPA: 1-deoxy-D-xylulose-5-phosphate reductoisomerase [Terriglobia bacterium]|nr:1-deoxy-D-xylulose-5-phosphate reductoisomerase [Terriglobia bacterium]